MSSLCPVCNNSIDDQRKICPTCGFKRIGSTQSFQPVSVSADDLVTIPERVAAAAVLKVVRGPQIGMAFALDKGTSVIGRIPQCDIFLNDMTVSRKHALIVRLDKGYQISDTNSFNGVWINNKSIDSVLLHDGDIIQVGAFCLLYQENMGE